MSSHATDATEVKCQHCGRAVEEGTALCPGCGRAPLECAVGGKAGEDIYLLLVTANVLRLRREWGLAEGKCSEVLRRDPGNAAAYSVLGDISRDQGKLRDAIEWYKMALDRNPGSAADRKKLEALIDRVFSGRRPGAAGKAGRALGRGWGRVLADVRGARPPSPALVMLGAMLVVILVIGISALLVGGGPAAEPEERQPVSGGFAVRPAGEAAPEEVAVGPDAGGPGVEALGTELAVVEAGLREEMEARARAIDPMCEVLSVEVDAETETARVRVGMPRTWEPSATRSAIERVAVGLAGAAARWDERIAAVRVRCDMRWGEGEERLALAAEGSARELAKADEGAGARAEEWFSFVWWHPELRG